MGFRIKSRQAYAPLKSAGFEPWQGVCKDADFKWILVALTGIEPVFATFSCLL
jgi:hypothetical protein